MRRLAACGSSSVSEGGVSVGVREDSDGTTHAGYGGVATCGSIWACPQCAAVIATRRADELADVMRAVDAAGGSAFMITLTVRHKSRDRLGWTRDQRRRWEQLERCRKARDRAAKGAPLNVDHAYVAEHWHGGTRVDDALDGLEAALARHHVCDVPAEEAERAELLEQMGTWDAVSDAWAAVTSGGTWVKDQKRHGGFLGWVKAVEVLHGENGWHPHVHALLCWADNVSEQDVAPITDRMFARWQKALRARGFDASGDFGVDGRRPGIDVRRAQLGNNDLAHYFTKLAHEVTGGHRKVGRRPGGLTPMALAVAAVDSHATAPAEVTPAVARWWEWEQGSEGRRQLTWSGTSKKRDRLRDLAGLGDEQTDEEIAAEEMPADERISLSAEVWGWVRAGEHTATVLDVAELEGLPGLARWLDDHGQTYVLGAGLAWIEQPPPGPSERIATWSGHGHGLRLGEIPRDQGTGAGWQVAAAAVLRGRDSAGRPLARPSDRPTRWTSEARSALASRAPA